MKKIPPAKQGVDADMEFPHDGNHLRAGEHLVPFVDLKRQYSHQRYEIRSAINRVLSSGFYISGPEVEAFEDEFATYCAVPYCIGLSNGVDAIEIALRALAIQPGDEVITVANAGMHSTVAIRAVGAIPVFAEVDPITLCLSPEGLDKATTSRSRAVIITHLYGRVADLNALCDRARKSNLVIVEDCFQAHGATLNGISVGSWGDVGCFCFSPTRVLGAMGEAGAMITGDLKIAEHARLLRQYGCDYDYTSHLPGGRSSFMDEVQAAVLRAKLPLLEESNLKRRLIAQTYHINLNTSRHKLTNDFQPEQCVYQFFVIRSSQREHLMSILKNRGIGCVVHYPIPDHLQPACSDLGYKSGALPETERASAEVLSLPCYPELSAAEVEQVCQIINDALNEDMI
jgi:dTDP-4-amino-4,6-dideoxygalactose transaminase